jgi:DHA1 family multidrug resistance protein-like MFS transporter
LAIDSWQRNLAANFVAELMAMAAFTFVDPLMPLYIQQVGGLTTAQAAFWAGLAASGLGVAMFFISPVWGILADRFGRKPMVMRAMFGGAAVLSLMSLAPNVYLIVFLRFLQGFVTGSVAAMTALASGIVPRNKMPFAMGIIMLAVFCGQSLGPLVGGFVADRWGYHVTFYASGAFLLLAGLTVLFMVKENFAPPPRPPGGTVRNMLKLAVSPQLLPLLVVLSLISVGQSVVGPIISLRVKEIVGADRAATTAGLIFSLIGLMAAGASVISGRLGERVRLPQILVFCCFAIGLGYLPSMWASSAAVLAVCLAMVGVFRGGLSTASNAMVGMSVAEGQQGLAYGLSQSAGSLGGAVGSLAGGGIARALGLPPVFLVAAAIFLIVGVVASRWLGARRPGRVVG